MHHAGLRAGGAPVQAGQRRPHQPGRGAAGDFAGQPLRRRKHQLTAELCGHPGTGVAVAEAVPESVPVLHRDKPGRPMGGELPGRQRVGVRLGSGFHHSADGHLLQHPDPYRPHQQPVGRSGGGMELHGGLCDGAGGLCMAAGGPGAGLGMLRPGAVCAVGRRGAGLGSGACGVFFQRLSEILAAVCIRHVRRVPADPGPAAEVRRGRSPGGGDAGAGGGPEHRTAPIWGPVRDGPGRGPGGKRGPVYPGEGGAGGLRIQQQLYQRRGPGGRPAGEHGHPPPVGGGGDPLSCGPHQRTGGAAGPDACGAAAAAGDPR